MSIDIHRVRQRKAELMQPQPLSHLKELEQIVEPKPHYVGPGPWLKAVKATVEQASVSKKEKNRGGRNAHS